MIQKELLQVDRMSDAEVLTSSTVQHPTFLYVGAAKSGSSWMYAVLREHPEVYVPAAKEIYFFNRHYERGFDWYLSFFKKVNGEKASGEVSHEYFLSESYAHRIHAHLPDAKIIFCLREGVERTFSAYLYDRTIFEHVGPKEFQRGLTFEAYATLPHIIKLSDYYRNMRPFFLLFPRDNILVLFYDDL
ncbi:MAG TPA: sulfotransferase, partial [Candidatus Binatia bacterium]